MRNAQYLLIAAAVVCVGFAPGALRVSAAATSDQPSTANAGSVPMTPSERDAQAKLEQAGYTNIRDVRSGPEGTTAVATKDGREMHLVVDSYGAIHQGY